MVTDSVLVLGLVMPSLHGGGGRIGFQVGWWSIWELGGRPVRPCKAQLLQRPAAGAVGGKLTHRRGVAQVLVLSRPRRLKGGLQGLQRVESQAAGRV